MNEHTNVAHVEREYAAFLEGDVDAVLEISAADAEYRYPEVEGMPYGGVWRGRDGVRRFFETHDAADEVLELRPTEVIAQRDRVVVLGAFRGRARSTGREWTTGFVHVYTIRDGRTHRFESFFDTSAFLVAHGLLPSASVPS
jgi:uncharacterized protein